MRALSLKQRRWLDAYLSTGNATEAARRAKYKAKDDRSFGVIGIENLRKLKIHVQSYLDEIGLSDEAIKLKIVQGLSAKETKYWAYEGKVTDEREVEALSIQAKYCEMGAKIRGLLDSEIGRRLDELEKKIDGLANA